MGFSFTHLILVVIILLLVFGPQRIEGIGTSLGKAIRGFKKGIEGVEEEHEKTVVKSTTVKEEITQDEQKKQGS